MIRKPLALRTFVSALGYGWAKVNASGHAQWASEGFKITENMIRKARKDAESSRRRPRAGYYICDQGPFRLARPEPEDNPTESVEDFGTSLLKAAAPEVELGAELPALFQEFANTPLTPEGIKGFVDRWGLLGGPIEQNIPVESPERLMNGRIMLVWKGFAGESAARWAAEIRSMAEGVQLWTLIKKKDETQLSQVLRRIEHEREARWAGTGWDIGEPDKRGDLLSRAQRELRDMVNVRLGQTFSPQLRALGRGTDEWDIYWEPTNLLDALWFQFAWAIQGNIDYRQCESCKRWMEISPGVGRDDKEYCSDACRMRAYRRRKGAKQ